ncbi:Bacterio-opsin activator HTH domain protein [Natrinema pellirubrum DSM 15624]|uniref:Bacterio-opsin activator HTH domain protein n=1 Tax=Natrinema pellirubrum (strain DSM 15624 / CIP 106293 / JCM 10476 / NCIMB 786 / 157) TaxID=797303 RepID=L0JGI6_NATP1|nr:helix-turn-helix domain-containing protein [Natrinema pellirubrum]AGB30650.1 putative DNA binding protein [Natrinema pellirubrum DSM 15624]ELY74874.1 Bacterio-opsin activator HTH domain protein [Natrinema pellirubrum DSM 15624]
MTGFRATVVVNEPADCPVATVSAEANEQIDSIARSSQATADGTVVEEFGVAADASIDESGDAGVELTPVQSNEREAIYRFERDAAADCVCEVVERTGTPVSSVRAQDGSLLLSFRTLELAEIADIVDHLRELFDGVLVEELTQDHEEVSADPVVVDREILTDRQQEIVETAHEMGYFDYPKGANATDVAEELGVARSTFTEHLAAAQTKLMDAILEEET